MAMEIAQDKPKVQRSIEGLCLPMMVTPARPWYLLIIQRKIIMGPAELKDQNEHSLVTFKIQLRPTILTEER